MYFAGFQRKGLRIANGSQSIFLLTICQCSLNTAPFMEKFAKKLHAFLAHIPGFCKHLIASEVEIIRFPALKIACSHKKT